MEWDYSQESESCDEEGEDDVSTPLQDKNTPWETMWTGIKGWRQKNVQYEKIDIKPYSISEFDRTQGPFAKSLSKSTNLTNAQIQN